MNKQLLPDLGLEVGDTVECHGAIGKVVAVRMDNSRHPVVVDFESGAVAVSFFCDGRYHPWHKTASLKLIEKKIKPKRKVTLRRYTYDQRTNIYQTAWTNEDCFDHNRTLVKTETKEIEID